MSQTTVRSGLLAGSRWDGESWSAGWFAGTAGRAAVLDKGSGGVLAEVSLVSAAQVDRVVGQAVAAQPDWAADGERRAVLLERAAQLVEAHRDEFVTWIIRESGSVTAKANGEVSDAVTELLVSAGHARAELAVPVPRMPGELLSTAERVPHGVVAVITPWNVPLVLALRSVAPALALGNAVVLKPDLQTPVSGGVLLARVFEQVGLPAAVFNLVVGNGPEVGEALVTSPGVSMVSFTGSTATGRAVAALAAPLLKKLALELGGKNPHVVLSDADLPAAAAAGVWGTFQHQGQVCMAIGRHVVDSSVVDAYTDELVARVRLLRQGDPSREDVELGPVINERQAARIEAIIADARDRGATVLVGGGRSGLYVQPTVLSGVRPGMRAYDEEVFGPVAVLIVADGESDAIRIANDTPYGLSASVHSRDAARAHMVADRIQSGMVHVNGQPINDNPWAPMGGIKASGVGGRFGAVADVEMFSTLRWRTVHDDTPQGFFPSGLEPAGTRRRSRPNDPDERSRDK